MKIMVVDDDREFLGEMVSVLKSSGYKVIPIFESQFAVPSVYKQRPDVLILDLKMNGTSGFEIADQLRRFPQTQHLPIICITGFYTQEEHQFIFRVCDVKELLTKPFEPLDIIAAIERVTNTEAR